MGPLSFNNFTFAIHLGHLELSGYIPFMHLAGNLNVESMGWRESYEAD